MTVYKVIFAYPVDNPPKELPKFTKRSLNIERDVLYEEIDPFHMIDVKRALHVIAPSAYPLIASMDEEFAEFFRNKGRKMHRIMIRTKIKPENIDMNNYPECVYMVQENLSEEEHAYYLKLVSGE